MKLHLDRISDEKREVMFLILVNWIRVKIKCTFDWSESWFSSSNLESFQFEWKLLKNWRQRVLKKGESARCILVCSAAWLIFARFTLRRNLSWTFFLLSWALIETVVKFSPFIFHCFCCADWFRRAAFHSQASKRQNYLQQLVLATRKTLLILLWKGFQLQKSIAFLFVCLDFFVTSSCSAA